LNFVNNLELWSAHQGLVREVAKDVLDIQCALTDEELDREELIGAMLAAFHGDPNQKCQGRTAGQRLQRAIAYGDDFKLGLPALRKMLTDKTIGR
jgi:hypothetical protein